MPEDRFRLLIVDGDPACRARLDAVFGLHGFQVTCTDSLLGVSELIRQVHPDVILLDVALPFRSGLTWLARLKADPSTASIPVVVLSAVPGALLGARRDLARAVLRKPFRTRSLVKAVTQACADRIGRRPVTSASASSRRRARP